MNANNTIGMTLYNARLRKNMTQEDAAELAKVCVETIRNIESGRTMPKLQTALKLWVIYDLPKEMLWDYQDDETEKLLEVRSE